MTIDKAYLLGLLIGGGKITFNSFIIKMPFKKWGLDPANMSTIAVDILTTICGKFRREFNISVNYEIGTNYWAIIPLASDHTTKRGERKWIESICFLVRRKNTQY